MSVIDWFIELQREAGYNHAAGIAQAEHLRPKKKPYLDESRPLTGTFFDYATESTGIRYKCDRLAHIQDDKYFSPFGFEPPAGGVDLDQFRKDCEEIDND
jgi:hypothetical protein